MIGDSICMDKMSEIKVLTLPQIDTLTDIMYNVGFGGVILLVKENACYQPRNAILFLDNTDKIFAYIEICFGCQHTEMSDKRIDIGDICNQKFEMIKKLFSNARIKYGAANED
jgi:adenylate cyclase class IV